MEKRTSEERDTLFHPPLFSSHFLNKKVRVDLMVAKEI